MYNALGRHDRLKTIDVTILTIVDAWTCPSIDKTRKFSFGSCNDKMPTLSSSRICRKCQIVTVNIVQIPTAHFDFWLPSFPGGTSGCILTYINVKNYLESARTTFKGTEWQTELQKKFSIIAKLCNLSFAKNYSNLMQHLKHRLILCGRIAGSAAILLQDVPTSVDCAQQCPTGEFMRCRLLLLRNFNPLSHFYVCFYFPQKIFRQTKSQTKKSQCVDDPRSSERLAERRHHRPVPSRQIAARRNTLRNRNIIFSGKFGKLEKNWDEKPKVPIERFHFLGWTQLTENRTVMC